MTKIINIRKKNILIYIGLIIALTFASVLISKSIRNINRIETITNEEAARFLAAGITEDISVFDNEDNESVYIDIVNESGCCYLKNGHAQVTYKIIKEIYEFYTGKIPEDIVDYKDEKIVSRNRFMNTYSEIISYLPYYSQIEDIEAGVAGMEMVYADLYKVYTSKGVYKYNTNYLKLKENDVYSLKVRGSYIVMVNKKENDIDEITYENVLIVKSNDSAVSVDIYGLIRSYKAKGIGEELNNVLADITIIEGKITVIDLKTDTITGKVLSVDKDSVDIEEYGKVPLDEKFLMYDPFDYTVVKNHSSIIVGYSLQDFIVAEGKICGAVISKKLSEVNIRVMIMTNGYKSLFHNNAVVSSSGGFAVVTDSNSTHYNANEEVTIEKDSSILTEGRVKIIPDGDNKIKVNSVNRSQGSPEYSGIIEIALYDEGLIIINDVDIEEYVSHVVPSEMPTSFGVEALKVQAVCARSYAYKELTNTNYSQYGAHVDDSIQYQVYNNTDDSDVANEAARQTAGQVLTYNGEVVQTYYYSTSCGVTTDISLWGSSCSDYPYYASTTVGSADHQLDLNTEGDFFTFITNTYDSDYDRECTLYRWNMTENVTDMGASIAAKTGNNIGTVKNITVNKRVGGGAAISITVEGDAGSIELNKESDIRTVLGNGSVDLNTLNGVTHYERLPSSFITFAPVYDGAGALTAYTIYGGGYGHGIGMSQNAVKAMCGTMTYEQILQFFYQGTSISVKK